MQIEAGQLAVLTGGGTGIGRALALQLSAQGVHLALCDVSAAAMAETRALCLAAAPAGTRVSTCVADVSDEQAVLAFRDAVRADHGTDHIHLLFNNAGTAGGGSFVSGGRADWERTFNVDWFGVYFCARAFLPLLVASPVGCIVNVSSVNGFWASLGPDVPHTAYSAAKFAVKGFTEALITDLRVNAPHVGCVLVMPGHVGTSIALNTYDARQLTAEQVTVMRARMVKAGAPVADMPDDAIRQLMHQRAIDFRDKAPTTAAQAATTILDAVRADHWRVLVGDDAQRLDAMVRADPEAAYEPAFAAAWRDANIPRGLSAMSSTVPTLDKAALLARYRAERDKRLRPDGNAQYLPLAGHLPTDDPYTPRTERAPKTGHVRFAFIGGGLAGLVTGARLVEAGVDDVCIIEKGGGFGGTWYWNRYPGAQCDTASMVYLPLLEETGHRPAEKYAHAPEILAQCQRIGTQYGLQERALFHTQVQDLRWDEAAAHWRIRTDRGDDFTADFIGLGTGPLHVPKLPGIPGIDSFAGHAFHTSRWDYAYTGGDPSGALMDKLADKRVALIGTGATAVQCVPHLARACGSLHVFQRTPSSVDVRNNGPIDPGWFASIATPGWQQRWLENFTANQAGGNAREDLVQDGWTELARRIRAKVVSLPPEQRTPQSMLAAFEEADHEKMNAIRARVDAEVHDPATAQALKAWYRQLCKRPCFHDAYLQAFNRPNCHLVDTDGQGVERITERGPVVAGVQYEVDCIVYASGFEVGTPYTARSGFDLVGRDGLKLSDAWADGMRSLHGVHVHGFPNAFFVQPTQGANLISNVPHNLTESGRTIATIVRHALDQGHRRVEVTQAAQDAWVQLLLSGPGRMIGGLDCTPGYYNNEGQAPTAASRLAVGYPAGPSAYFQYLAGWRSSGGFEGLAFS